MPTGEKTITLFAVSSVRSFSDGELYYGTDAIFLDADRADAYVRDEMKKMLKDEIDDRDLEDLRIDYDDYIIETTFGSFGWTIEEIKMRLSEADQFRLRQMVLGCKAQ